MKTIAERFAELSGQIYNLCSQKELVRRKCLNLGRMECRLLNFLYNSKDPICMNDLAVQMQVSHSRITRLIDALVTKGFVERFPSKIDRRSWLAHITKKGKEINERTNHEFLELQKELINNLPKEDVKSILNYLNDYVEAYTIALEKKENEFEQKQK